MSLAHSVLLQNTKIPADKVPLFRKGNDSASCRLWSRSPNLDRRLMHVSHLRRILWQEVHRETTRLKACTFKLRCPRAIYCNFSTYHLEIQRRFSTSPLRILCISRVSQPPLSFQLFPLRTTEDTFKEKGIWSHNTTDKNVSCFFFLCRSFPAFISVFALSEIIITTYLLSFSYLQMLSNGFFSNSWSLFLINCYYMYIYGYTHIYIQIYS